MLDEYGDYFSEPSAADEIIEKAKEDISALLSNEVKSTVEKAVSAKEELSDLQREIYSRQFELERLKQNIDEMRDKCDKTENYEVPRRYIQKFVKNAIGGFVPGDKVWVIGNKREEQKCQTCGGSRKTIANIDAVGEVEVSCPVCSGRGYTFIDHYSPVQRIIDRIDLKLCFSSNRVNYWNRENIYLTGREYSIDLKDIYPTEAAAREAISEREKKSVK